MDEREDAETEVSESDEKRRKDRHVVLSMKNCRFIKKESAGK